MKIKILNRINRLFRNLGISMLYETRFGFKGLNPTISSRLLYGYVSRPFVLIAPETLKLSVDGLKDQYTLLDCPLGYSPHYELMRMLHKGPFLKDQSAYLSRMSQGTLDFRRPLLPEIDITLFNERRQAIITKEYLPIFVCQFKSHTYIIDGKHRAALCMILEQPVKAIFINDFLYDSHYFWLMQRMANSHVASDYRKHLNLFKSLFPNA